MTKIFAPRTANYNLRQNKYFQPQIFHLFRAFDQRSASHFEGHDTGNMYLSTCQTQSVLAQSSDRVALNFPQSSYFWSSYPNIKVSTLHATATTVKFSSIMHTFSGYLMCIVLFNRHTFYYLTLHCNSLKHSL